MIFFEVVNKGLERVKKFGWKNVEVIEADATTFVPKEGYADLITFSYSLTMIPDWFLAIENSLKLLRPGGQIGVTNNTFLSLQCFQVCRLLCLKEISRERCERSTYRCP